MRVFHPVFADLHPQFQMHLPAEQFLHLQARGAAYRLDAAPPLADDHGLVGSAAHINHGMHKGTALVFQLFPMFNLHGCGIRRFLRQAQKKLFPDDFGRHKAHGCGGKLLFRKLRRSGRQFFF